MTVVPPNGVVVQPPTPEGLPPDTGVGLSPSPAGHEEVTVLDVPSAGPSPVPAYRIPGAPRAWRGWTLPALVSLAVAVACALFVFVQMRPDLLLADTTPAGGDMGAHVWGPAFLRDHLLPSGRLTGWTPDWYAGFPAYHFYMVVPSLLIVAVNAGFRPFIGIPLAIVVIGLAWRFTGNLPAGDPWRRAARVGAPLASVLLMSVPYGISFKLVSVSGLVAFPVVAWAMARLARSPEPVPAFAALAATIFLFDTNFSITGGNIASTLAGEFAFSLSLALTLLAIGLAARGLDTGRGRALAAVVIGLTALCHIIPVFFGMVALIALVPLSPTIPRLWPVAVAVGLALVPVAMAEDTSTPVRALALVAAVGVLAAVVITEDSVQRRALWMLTVGPVSILVSAFWLLPFVVRHPYFNDMGWEPLTEFGPKMLTVPMRVALPLAGVGLVLSLATRDRIGLVFSTTALVAAAAVTNLPPGALWNERLLPFYYLSVYLAAAVGVALVVRYAAVAVAEDLARPHTVTVLSASVVGLLFTLTAVGLPLRVLPLGQARTDGTWRWMGLTSNARSFVPSWTAWNYSGYERKPAYREYHDIVAAMAQVGRDEGCGRAMWEYSKDLDRYGTPMALMLLPFWTDGCIGSMEGLYFESSATTPFHFLNQSSLSDSPSRAQRDLPYQSFDINRGTAQLQVMGVRYYMAQSDNAIAAARNSDLLTEVAAAPPFVIFEVKGSDLVEALPVEPVVALGETEDEAGPAATKFDVGWVSQAVVYFNNPSGFNAMPAEDGPESWERVSTLIPGDGQPVERATVSNIEAGTSTISFDVDRVGTPVLVKASYFPNWKADGADGPWRVGPNLMVVVPTANHVELGYGRTGIDWLATLFTLGGVAGVAGLARLDRRRWAEWGGGPGGDAGAHPGLPEAMAAPAGGPAPAVTVASWPGAVASAGVHNTNGSNVHAPAGGSPDEEGRQEESVDGSTGVPPAAGLAADHSGAGDGDDPGSWSAPAEIGVSGEPIRDEPPAS